MPSWRIQKRLKSRAQAQNLIPNSMNSLSWWESRRHQVMPDDHSKLVPLLPISNRTVKRLSADDSADSRVKVGHRQASNSPKRLTVRWGVFFRRHKKSFKESAKAWYNRRLRWSQRGKQSSSKLLGFFKNIQPISVGVWWWLPSSSELSFN